MSGCDPEMRRYDHGMRRAFWITVVALALTCAGGLALSNALAQDRPALPNPGPPAGPDYVHIHVVYWICTLALAALGGAGTTIKVMWGYQGTLAKDHATALAQQVKDHSLAMSELTKTHAQEIVALYTRLDREQSERRQDASEVNKACMTALNVVTAALDKNTEQVTRLANGWVDGGA